MIGVLGAQYKLQINIMVELPINCAFQARWTNQIRIIVLDGSNLVQFLVTLDLDPSARSERPSHRWVADHDTEVLLALLWDESLIEGLGLVRFGTGLIIIFKLFYIVVIMIKPLIDTTVVIHCELLVLVLLVLLSLPLLILHCNHSILIVLLLLHLELVLLLVQL